MNRVFSLSFCASILFATTAQSATENLLYSFGGYHDGAFPVAGMTKVKGVLYGATEYGGTGSCYSNWLSGCGIVFSFDPQTNQERVVYAFNGGTDGGYPYSRLHYRNGTLYGTTYEGGGSQNCYDGHNYGCGTIFSINLSTGKETVLHAFTGSGVDGASPFTTPTAPSPDAKELFGTTAYGGTGSCQYSHDGCGTVFKINLSTGAFTTVYSFQSNGTDAIYPTHDWTVFGAKMFSTTYTGGAYGYGTIFSFDPKTGAETVLHSFGKGSDGRAPYAGMTEIGSLLYGATTGGGAHKRGTVFSFDPETGAETIMYSFCRRRDCADGEGPVPALIHWKGVLYGETAGGGARDYGTIFSFNPKTGIETVLHSNGYGNLDPFENNRLLQLNGTLYGTVPETGNNDEGAIFSITP